MKHATLALIVSAVLLSACGPPKLRGIVEAEGAQELAQPLGSAWPEPLQRRCGDEPIVGRLEREPYVQWVAADRATVVWGSSLGRDERLRVASTDGSRVDRRRPVRDADGPWRATVPFLEAGSVYCYAIERRGEVVAGPFALRTAPIGDSYVEAIVLGDSGTGWPEQHAVAESMQRVGSDLILHTGDVAYDTGGPDRYQTTVFDVYGALLRSVPMFPAVGNHDLEVDSGAAYDRAFHVPDSPAGRAYSFDYGPAHFVALDTTADLRAQARWLDADLASTRLPWRVVFMHHPPYSSGGHHGSNDDVRRALSPVFARHGVQLVFAGHDHHYERSRASNGTVYVVTGGGGRELRPIVRRPWTERAVVVHHFVHLRIAPTHIELRAIDGAGRVFDRASVGARP